MGDFRISDKPENNNPTSTALCLVENINVPGEYYKVPVADLNKGFLNGIAIDDTNKADGYILAYNQTDNKFEYVENTSGGGGGTWGSITGTLSDQTDLQTELNAKQSKSQEIAFNEETIFNGNTRSYKEQTGVISKTFAATGQPTEGEHIHEDIIDGDSTNAINVTIEGQQVQGSTDNTKRNIITSVYNADLPTLKGRVIINNYPLPVVETNPLIITNGANIFNTNADNLSVEFDKIVTITDTTGLSLSGVSLTIDSIISGNGSNTIVFQLSGNVLSTDVLSLVVDNTNNIQSASGSLPLIAVTTSIVNNVTSGTVDEGVFSTVNSSSTYMQDDVRAIAGENAFIANTNDNIELSNTYLLEIGDEFSITLRVDSAAFTSSNGWIGSPTSGKAGFGGNAFGRITLTNDNDDQTQFTTPTAFYQSGTYAKHSIKRISDTSVEYYQNDVLEDTLTVVAGSVFTFQKINRVSGNYSDIKVREFTFDKTGSGGDLVTFLLNETGNGLNVYSEPY